MSMKEFDQTKPAFWRQVLTGAIFTLKDMQTLEGLMEHKGDAGAEVLVQGLDLTVGMVWRNKTSAFDLIMFEASGSAPDGEPTTMYIVAKIIGAAMDLRAYFNPGGLEPGTRQELLERGITWPFDAPLVFNKCPNCQEDNPKNEPFCPNCKALMFVPGELAYAKVFNKETISKKCPKCGTVAKSEREKCSKCKTPLIATFPFTRKSQGIVHGECNDGSGENKFVTIVEYSAAPEKCVNGDYLFLEIGGLNNEPHRPGKSNLLPEGGWVILLQGCALSVYTDIKVIS